MAEDTNVDVERDASVDADDSTLETAGDDKPRDSAKDERRRQNLANRLREEEKAKKDLAAQLDATQAELEKLRGDRDAIEKRKEKKWRELEDENANLKAMIERDRNEQRFGTLLDRVTTETGLDKFTARALLREAHNLDPDAFEIAPEVLTERDVKDALKALTRHAPAQLESREGGKARNRPGPAPTPHMGGVPTGDPSDDQADYWRKRGAAASAKPFGTAR